MKQLLQSLKDGSTELVDVPAPNAVSGKNLIRTSRTLVSAGTERMLVQFGKSNVIQKARSQPDKVKMVIEKAKTDGVVATFDAVKSKLDQPLALGYCNVGTIIEPCDGIFRKGDRVVSNGKHAEIVAVEENLCAKIPDDVTDDTASFTILAAIGLQGIRLAKVTLGETVVVTGLGLIGLLTVQMLRANGCKVIGIDVDPNRMELAKAFGAEVIDPNSGEDVIEKARTYSDGNGVDAVIITATAKSDDPVSQAAKMCRKRGRIILVGVVGLNLNRADFYEKELTFQVSCSYGPGRYDDNYEEKGNDYPIGYVRWTERRNFDAVLYMMSVGLLQVEKLISHRYDFSEGEVAMQLLSGNEPSMGILLDYSGKEALEIERSVRLNNGYETIDVSNDCNVGFAGAGNYAGRVLMPAFKAAGANLNIVASSGGVSAVYFGKKFGFRQATTDSNLLFESSDIDAVIIATRHNAHASQVLNALDHGKHVFCEKPLCLTIKELDEIQDKAASSPSKILMVGFNRRFAPQVQKMKRLLGTVTEPKSILITVNAGKIPSHHWTQDLLVGGGRMVGEGCHFVDLARHLVGCPISDFNVQSLGAQNSVEVSDDKFTVNLAFEDGSFASINYLANGHKGFPKERVEVFTAGRVLQLDNFRILKGWGWPNFKYLRLWRQNKGQVNCVNGFVRAVQGFTRAPIPKEEIFEISRLSIQIAKALRD